VAGIATCTGCCRKIAWARAENRGVAAGRTLKRFDFRDDGTGAAQA